jgi:hypothetical protein
MQSRALWQQEGWPVTPVDLLVATGDATTNEDGSTSQPVTLVAKFEDGSELRATGLLSASGTSGAAASHLAGVVSVTNATGMYSGFHGALKLSAAPSPNDETETNLDISGEVCR